jgi:hypothetical protein
MPGTVESRRLSSGERSWFRGSRGPPRHYRLAEGFLAITQSPYRGKRKGRLRPQMMSPAPADVQKTTLSDDRQHLNVSVRFHARNARKPHDSMVDFTLIVRRGGSGIPWFSGSFLADFCRAGKPIAHRNCSQNVFPGSRDPGSQSSGSFPSPFLCLSVRQ